MLLRRGSLPGIEQGFDVKQVYSVVELFYLEGAAADAHKLGVIFMPVKYLHRVVHYTQIKRVVVVVYRCYPALGARTVKEIAFIKVYRRQIEVRLFFLRLREHTLLVQRVELVKVYLTVEPAVERICAHRVYDDLDTFRHTESVKTGTQSVKRCFQSTHGVVAVLFAPEERYKLILRYFTVMVRDHELQKCPHLSRTLALFGYNIVAV